MKKLIRNRTAFYISLIAIVALGGVIKYNKISVTAKGLVVKSTIQADQHDQDHGGNGSNKDGGPKN